VHVSVRLWAAYGGDGGHSSSLEWHASFGFWRLAGAGRRPDGLGVEVNPANAQPAAGFRPIDPQALGVSAFALSLEVLVCVRASRGRAAGVRRMGAVSSPRRTRAHAGLPSIVRAR
jgi:hypothetical protein